MQRVLQFGRLMLRLAPKATWWVLAVLGFSLLNLALRDELWPHTPWAMSFFTRAVIGCLVALPWLAARLAWRLADAVESYFWKSIWRLGALLGYGGASLLTLIGLVALVFGG